MTRWGQYRDLGDLSKPGRCTKCRKIGPRSSPLGLCAKCMAWTEAGAVGPTPLDPELARPFLLVDPGFVDNEWRDDENQDESMIRRALEAPWILESLEFVEAHRNHACPEYDGCLSVAASLDWVFFTCRGCKFFPQK